jgi:transcriptional regulator with XRE-family HTH domain
MASRDELLNATVGRRVADLRKRKGLSQSELAFRLARRRTQAWMSNVESGSRSMSSEDLVNVAATLETTVGELFSNLSTSPRGGAKSLTEFMTELDSRIPLEMPVYLQRDIGKTDKVPIDYHFAANAPNSPVFYSAQLHERIKALSMVVIEGYYEEPRLQPSDLVALNSSMSPVYDPDARLTDRVMIKLPEPYDGFQVHAGVINSSSREVTFQLVGRDPVVFGVHEYELLGVLIWRRTDYHPSMTRTWFQRKFGITKDDRGFEREP